jgi:2-iminobutanoate/2-iminopropanoate deaminase
MKRVINPQRILYLAGQLGEHPDGSISDAFADQVRQIWINIKAILAEASMEVADIVKVVSYIVGEANIKSYVAIHRDIVGAHLPPWTLVVVQGLGRPQYLVEVEVIAAR